MLRILASADRYQLWNWESFRPALFSPSVHGDREKPGKPEPDPPPHPRPLSAGFG
jgi:hypothetical protein